MTEPNKRVEDLMAELRRDLEGWKAQLPQLTGEEHADIAPRIKEWISQAERVLARWGNSAG